MAKNIQTAQRGGRTVIEPHIAASKTVTPIAMDILKPIPSPCNILQRGECPLFVDMDGTLISTDMLWESAMMYASRHPFQVWRLAVWLSRGKACLKRELANRVQPNAATLPYRKEVVDFLREEKEKGRSLILATASDELIADKVAEHLSLFDGVIASDGETNLSRGNKLAAILERSHDGRFGYMGNSTDDLSIWEKSTDPYLVTSSKSLINRARRVCKPARIFGSGGVEWKALLKALRTHQWVKNLLLLIPLFASHRAMNLPVVVEIVLAMATFSVCASSVYVVNDLLDIEADRLHARKRLRPFAAGTLPIPWGIAAAVGLVVSGLVASVLFLPWKFSLLLALYMVSTTAYSFYFKRRLLQDVFLLAGLYTLRILAGGAAVGVEISPWLLAFSLFFFLSLAFVKRYSELLIVMGDDKHQASGRGYITQDLEVLASVGPASGYLAVMVLCLYLNSDVVRGLYRHPMFLWGVTPIILYWITRIWFLARRQTLADDPVVFAVRDRVSLATGVIVGVIFFLAI